MSAAMAEYLKSLVCNEGDAKIQEKSNEDSINNAQPLGMGDFDYNNSSQVSLESLHSNPNYWLFESNQRLSTKFDNAKTLVITLEKELAESVQDLYQLANKINSAEEVLPKRWERYEDLKKECRDQCDQMGREIAKYTRKIDRHNSTLLDLEEKVGSWQYLINKMKSEIPEPFGIPALDNRKCEF